MGRASTARTRFPPGGSSWCWRRDPDTARQDPRFSCNQESGRRDSNSGPLFPQAYPAWTTVDVDGRNAHGCGGFAASAPPRSRIPPKEGATKGHAGIPQEPLLDLGVARRAALWALVRRSEPLVVRVDDRGFGAELLPAPANQRCRPAGSRGSCSRPARAAPPASSAGSTSGGDWRQLRGLPAISRGTSGPIPGTDPLRALLGKERRRRR